MVSSRSVSDAGVVVSTCTFTLMRLLRRAMLAMLQEEGAMEVSA